MAMLAPFDELHEIIGLTAVLVAIACSVVFGARPYRLAGFVIAFDAFGWLAVQWLFDQYDRVLLSHGKSVVIFGLLAVIVLRFPGRGLVSLLCLQLLAVLIHISVWVDRSIRSDVNGLILNVIGWGMLAVLVAGSLQRFGRQLTIDTTRP